MTKLYNNKELSEVEYTRYMSIILDSSKLYDEDIEAVYIIISTHDINIFSKYTIDYIYNKIIQIKKDKWDERTFFFIDYILIKLNKKITPKNTFEKPRSNNVVDNSVKSDINIEKIYFKYISNNYIYHICIIYTKNRTHTYIYVIYTYKMYICNIYIYV